MAIVGVPGAVEEEDHDAVAPAASSPSCSPSRSLPLPCALPAAAGGQARRVMASAPSSSAIDGVPVPADAGEVKEHDVVAASASSPSSSPSRSLPLPRVLPAAAGGQARRVMASASSSSFQSSAAAGSESQQAPSRRWILLWRMIAGAEAEAETEHDAWHDALAEVETETEHDAWHDALAAAEEAEMETEHAAAAPDPTLALALPPQIAVVSTGPGAHLDRSRPDEHPLLLFAPNRGLLLEFTESGSTAVSRLMLARNFHTEEGLVDRPGGVPVLRSTESLTFSSKDGEFIIAELQLDADCSVNVSDFTVVAHDGSVYQLVDLPGPPRPASTRYVVPLPAAIGADIKLEHNTLVDETILPITQEEDTILSVWRENLGHAFHLIQNLMPSKEMNWVIAIDTEFCPQELPPPQWTNPPFGYESYTHMRHSVDEGQLVQVGIAITSLHYPQATKVFEFNIQFDPTTRPENSKSVAFLRKTNPQLDEHASRGIIIEQFINGLSNCGVLNNTAVTWVSYQGFSDYGYLLRGLIQAQRMPDNRIDFLTSVKKLFPKNYDLKTFHEIGFYCDESVKGKANLEALALNLGAERTGIAHTAGSDALLTVHCFCRIVAREKAFAPIMRLQGNVFRMEPIILDELPANYDRYVSVLRMNSRNFEMEGRVLQRLFPIFGIVSAEIKFSSREEMRTYNYDTACQDMGHMIAAEVVIAISDPRGWPAYGKLWTFNLSNGDNSITSGMLADLLTKIGALSNPSVTWISSEVGLFLYLVNVCTTASLPVKRNQFNTLCSGFFPTHFIVPAGPEDSQSDPESKVLPTLRRFLQGSNASKCVFRKILF